MPEDRTVGTESTAPLVGSRRRFLRRAAVVGIGSATALLMPIAAVAEE